jgi:hypothetical protein
MAGILLLIIVLLMIAVLGWYIARERRTHRPWGRH